MYTVPIEKIKLAEGFLTQYTRLVSEIIIPYQWEVMNDRIADAEKSHCIKNIKIAAGREDGEFGGLLFQDSDVAKWLEAVAYCLQNGTASEYEAIADEVIALIKEAQQPNGYFNTYFQLNAPERIFTDLYVGHELY